MVDARKDEDVEQQQEDAHGNGDGQCGRVALVVAGGQFAKQIVGARSEIWMLRVTINTSKAELTRLPRSVFVLYNDVEACGRLTIAGYYYLSRMDFSRAAANRRYVFEDYFIFHHSGCSFS